MTLRSRGRRRLLAAALAGIGMSALAARGGKEKTMADLFEIALAEHDRAYLDAESRLLAAGDAARRFLVGVPVSDNAVARLLRDCLLAWLGTEAQSYTQALAMLDDMAASAADTPAGRPRAVQVAEQLRRRFGGGIVDLMALRLLKLPSWPAWRRRGAMLYLKIHTRPALTDVLILIAAQASDEVEQRLAVDAVLQAQDPQLKPKLRNAKLALTAQGGRLPPDLEDLLVRP